MAIVIAWDTPDFYRYLTDRLGREPGGTDGVLPSMERQRSGIQAIMAASARRPPLLAGRFGTRPFRQTFTFTPKGRQWLPAE
jgi:hypothetical protein